MEYTLVTLLNQLFAQTPGHFWKSRYLEVCMPIFCRRIGNHRKEITHKVAFVSYPILFPSWISEISQHYYSAYMVGQHETQYSIA